MQLPGRLFFLFLFIFISDFYAQEHDAHNYYVRVLLQEKEEPSFSWSLESSDGFIIIDPDQKTKTSLPGKTLEITKKKKLFLLNNIPYQKQKIYIKPIKNYLKFEDKEYQGSFLITYNDQKTYLINSLDIEDYVCSVLRTESWPGWPLEVNKAFAIASRSYVMGVILNNKSTKLPYHVKNTNKHQTYSGLHDNPILKEAVKQTRGIFLAYEGNPIIAMYDSCCGGVTPADIDGINFLHAPYLERTYPCNFCKDCKMYSWTANYPVTLFEKEIAKEFKKIKKIKSIKISKKDKAGLVQQLHIKGHSQLVNLSSKKIYSLFSKKIRSFYYDVVLNSNKVIFNGKGVGHHMGLCQWGAREMVRQGYSAQRILSFYFPGTHFMKLK